MANSTAVPAPIDRQRLGCDAEARAAQQLLAAGLSLLHRNYRCRMGELDLIARAKRRRIVLATRHLLARYPALQKLPVRFDAMLVGAENGPIEWLRGAFDAS